MKTCDDNADHPPLTLQDLRTLLSTLVYTQHYSMEHKQATDHELATLQGMICYLAIFIVQQNNSDLNKTDLNNTLACFNQLAQTKFCHPLQGLTQEVIQTLDNTIHHAIASAGNKAIHHHYKLFFQGLSSTLNNQMRTLFLHAQHCLALAKPTNTQLDSHNNASLPPRHRKHGQ